MMGWVSAYSWKCWRGVTPLCPPGHLPHKGGDWPASVTARNLATLAIGESGTDIQSPPLWGRWPAGQRGVFGAAVAAIIALALPAHAQQTNAIPQMPSGVEEIQKYCSNLTDNAADARYAIQTKELNDLRKQVDERVAALEEKRKEYEVWLQRRNEFIAKAQDSLVEIISKMKPDAAAAQLALIDDEAAAALLLKLSPRTSSVILNEMPAEKSAQLARVIVGAQSTEKRGSKTKPETAGRIQ